MGWGEAHLHTLSQRGAGGMPMSVLSNSNLGDLDSLNFKQLLSVVYLYELYHNALRKCTIGRLEAHVKFKSIQLIDVNQLLLTNK